MLIMLMMMLTPVVGCVMWTPGMLNTVNCSSIEGMYLVGGHYDDQDDD